jgi:hypothetical protein
MIVRRALTTVFIEDFFLLDGQTTIIKLHTNACNAVTNPPSLRF